MGKRSSPAVERLRHLLLFQSSIMASQPAGISGSNSLRFGDLLNQYAPFLVIGAGLVLVFSAGVLAFSSHSEEADVVFHTQESATDSAALIRVDVAGAVLRPGVYSVPAGSRINDAIAAALGLTDQADSQWIERNLNRAAKLVDGGKVYIPEKETGISDPNQRGQTVVMGISTQSDSLYHAGDLLNINSADQSALEGLPGVGPVTAQKIISGRPYQAIEELKTKKILGSAAFEKIKNLLTL